MNSKIRSLLFFLTIFLVMLSVNVFTQTGAPKVTIPTAGNSWLINSKKDSSQVVTKQGIAAWKSKADRIGTYFYLDAIGTVDLWIRARARSGTSKIQVSLGRQRRATTITNNKFKDIYIGTFRVKEKGYQRIEFAGLEKAGATFPDVVSVLLGGAARANNVNHIKDDFYFGRRGPSVHLWFNRIPTKQNIRWFYNEITVPKGQDVIGSYFMANGFSHGYFGIQVNSKSERRILFSVWSPFKTDNPNKIPEEFRIRLLKKGSGVIARKFGNEGSGGQSFRRFNWKASTRYRFLLKGEPAGNNSTNYSAYFFAPEIGRWQLIASFNRPKTNTYLKGLYSFLENFKPNTGAFDRKAMFSNQWVADAQGRWHELTEAKFTADSTARKGNRLDYTGGVEEGSFYLKNCGFFNGNTNLDIYFKRKALGNRPRINLNSLP